ncbi:hypothetical protein Tco_0149099 [Tanacetum coccineum]
MDDKTQAYAERQAERKRKYDDLSKNNQNQQNKRQNTGQAYTAGNSDRKSYAGSKPLCSKCNCHLEAGYGPANNKTTNRNNKQQQQTVTTTSTSVTTTTINQQANGCFECGAHGHLKRILPETEHNDSGMAWGLYWAHAKGSGGG